VTFERQGRRRSYTVPPTYDYSVNQYALELLTRTLEPDGYRVAPGTVPLKLLAVRTGLAAYGRNNITYVPGMGSYHRLMAFFSDLPAGEDIWLEPASVERCTTCTACIQACPTKAIAGDRFLLHAERCISFLNEHEGGFPDWVDPSWHNCVVGCMLCQSICPENRRLTQAVETGPTFAEEETALLLRGASFDRLPTELAQKLESLSLVEYLNVLPRNLKALFDREFEENGMASSLPPSPVSS
jgi:epoxyqueuosine reductase